MTTEPDADVLIDPIAVTLELTLFEMGALLALMRLGMDRYTAGYLGTHLVNESAALLDKIPKAILTNLANKLQKMEFREKTK